VLCYCTGHLCTDVLGVADPTYLGLPVCERSVLQYVLRGYPHPCCVAAVFRVTRYTQTVSVVGGGMLSLRCGKGGVRATCRGSTWNKQRRSYILAYTYNKHKELRALRALVSSLGRGM
jgi:hypothetical protein